MARSALDPRLVLFRSTGNGSLPAHRLFLPVRQIVEKIPLVHLSKDGG
jgi:hypothetical protein